MTQIQKWAAKNSAARSEAIRRLVEPGLKVKLEIARARDLSRYPWPNS
jgi:hypothetical protein